MRFVYLFALVVILVAVVIFAWQNHERETLRFLNWSVSWPMALFIAVVYVLGMVSGWSVFGFLKRSIKEVARHRPA
jgi:lipopolysaccharide assembly protein A